MLALCTIDLQPGGSGFDPACCPESDLLSAPSLVPIMGFGLVYSVHKYGGCWRYYTLHMVDRYSNLVDTTLLHHDFALDI